MFGAVVHLDRQSKTLTSVKRVGFFPSPLGRNSSLSAWIPSPSSNLKDTEMVVKTETSALKLGTKPGGSFMLTLHAFLQGLFT